MKDVKKFTAPPVYCPVPSREALQAKFPNHSPASPVTAFLGGSPPVYRPSSVVAPRPEPFSRNPVPPSISPARDRRLSCCSVILRAMTDDEFNNNARVQALKPQVDTLEGYINAGTLGTKTLATLRALRDAVQESIRLRTRLQSLGHDAGHAARIVVEQGFETAVVAEIATKEAAEQAAARAAENARLAAGPSLLSATSTWGRRA